MHLIRHIPAERLVRGPRTRTTDDRPPVGRAAARPPGHPAAG